MINSNIELFGRKTFFFAADNQLVPGACLERLMKHGYEAYLVGDSATAPLEDKVRAVIRLYPDAILFFNIDASVRGIDWQDYIRGLLAAQEANILVGVVYKMCAPELESQRKSFYEQNLRVSAGCLMLESGEEEIFQAIREILARNGARGRRNLVRADCDKDSTVTFSCNGESRSGRLLDINVTHFLCDMKGKVAPLPMFQKVKDAKLRINGFDLQSNAVLIMKRQSLDANLCIFMFIKQDDSPDLEREQVIQLNKKIYQIVTDKNMSLLKATYMGRKN